MDLKSKPYEFESFKILADLSQQSRCFSLGFFFCKQIIIKENQISEDLSELLDQSLKNKLEPLRKSLLTLDLIQQQRLSDYENDMIQEVKFDIYMDLTKILNLRNEVSKKLEKVSALKDDFSILYFMKLHADFLRYSIEYTHGQIQNRLIKNCEKAYNLATVFSVEKFSPIFHLKLGLLLNKAIFIKKHLKNTQEAIRVLQDCIKNSEKFLERSSEKMNTKSQKIFRLIFLNLKEWDKENTLKIVNDLNNIIK